MRKKKKSIRVVVQVFFFLLIAAIAVNHVLVEQGAGVSWLSSASLHSLCPFGGVVSFYQYLTVGTLVQKIHESSLILMIIMFVLAVLFGPVFCGWVCPLGSFQEWIGKLGKKFAGDKYNRLIPKEYDKYLRFLRYGILLWVLYVTAQSGKLIFADYDPYKALFEFWSGEVAASALLILGAVIVTSLLVERPWCKYLCPYGAILGISNIFRVFKVRRSENSCVSCGLCDSTCPMNIEVSKHDVVRDHQCISCLECTSERTCQVKDTVVMATKGVAAK